MFENLCKLTFNTVPLPEETKRGTSRKWGALKYIELSHVKTDIIRLQFMRNFKNSVFMSKKRHIRPATFLSSFHLQPIIALKIYLQQ